MLHIDIIDQGSGISDEDREDIQDRFNQMTNFAVKWQSRKVKKNGNIPKFKQCYFCINDGNGLKPIADVYLHNGSVRYTIVSRHLDELGLSSEQAEAMTIKYIVRPSISEKLDCIFSIFSGVVGSGTL